MSRPFTLFPDDEERKPGALSLFPDDPPSPLKQSLHAGAEKAPDRAARVLRMQTKTGLPAPVIERNLDEVERRAAAADFDVERFRRDSPVVAEWLAENPQHAALAKDDMAQLGYIESLIEYGANLVRGAYYSAKEAAYSGAQAFQENAVDRTSLRLPYSNRLNKSLQEHASAAHEEVGRAAPKNAGFIGRNVYSGLLSVVQQAPLYAVSAAVGNPAPVLAGMGLLSGGQAYGEARRQGVSPGKALLFAGGQLSTDVLTEMIPAGTVVKEFRLHQGFRKLLMQELKQEMFGEQIATGIQDFNEWLVLPENKNKTIGDFVRERPSRFADTFASTIVAVGATSAGVRVADRALTGKTTEQLIFEGLSKGVTESKTFQRMPEAVQELIRRKTADGPLQTFFQPVDSWQEYWRSKDADPRSVAEELLGRDGLAEYDEAVATGRDIAIPAAEAINKLLADQQHATFFARELRLEPEEMNAREAEEFLEEDPDIEVPAEDKSFVASAARVREDVVGQLVGQGYSPASIEAHAKLYEQVYRTMGQNLGVDPFDLYQRRGLTIQREIPEILRNAGNVDASLDAALDRLRSGKVPTDGEIFGVSLVDFLRSKGGLKDEGGELSSLEVDADRKKFQRNLVQAKGLSLDTARELAAEAGYLPTNAPISHLLDLIEREVRGTPVYAVGAENQEVMETATVLNQLSGYLDAINVDVRNTSNQEIRKRLTQAAEGPAFGQTFAQSKDGLARMREMIDKLHEHPARTRNNAPFVSEKAQQHFLRGLRTAAERYDPGAVEFIDRAEAALARGDGRVYTQQSEVALMRLHSALARSEETGEPPATYRQDKRGFIQFGVDKQGKPVARITLTNDANLSTFLHESGHLWLQMLIDVSGDLEKMTDKLSEKQKRILSDRQILLDWFGIKDRGEIQEKHHEQFARGFEAYLAEGKAPSPELGSIFQRFRSWLLGAYRLFRSAAVADIGKRLDVQLSDEVRGVMDRLLASEEEIQQAEEEAHVQALFEDDTVRAAMGMSSEQFEPYKKTVEQARQAAREELDAKLVKEAARQSEKWWQDRRAEVRDQVASEVYRDKGYRALANIRDGKFPDGSELPAEDRIQKLDAKAIEARYGKASRKAGEGSSVTNTLLEARVYTRQGGVHPDAAAEFLGYSSGEDLINDLIRAHNRPMSVLIEEETTSRMRAMYGDSLLDGTITDAARAAVMGPGRSEVIHAEMKALKAKLREVAPFVKAEQRHQQFQERQGLRELDTLPSVEVVRAWAQKRVGESKVRDVKPALYWQAARKAAKQAFDAAARQQWHNAYNFKLAELRNAEMYRAMRGTVDQVNRGVQEFHELFVPDKRLEKTHDLDFMKAAQAIAATVLGMPNHQTAAIEYLERVRDYDPDLYDTLKEQIQTALASKATYKDMTVSEFEGVRDIVSGLAEMSRRNRQMLIDGKLLEREAVQLELTMRVAQVAKVDAEKLGYHKAVTKWEKTRIHLMGIESALRRVESWVDAIDGGKADGVFRKYIWNPISDATAKYRIDKVRVLQQYLDIVKEVEAGLTYDKIEAPELAGPFSFDMPSSMRGYTFSGKTELLHAVLHSGNSSNLSKLLRGRGWGGVNPDGTLDATAWFAFLDRMQDQGVLTKRDFDFVQDVWNLLESLKPISQRAHKAMYGRYFKELTAEPLVTKFGVYKGGYVPAVVDPFAAPDAANRSDKQLLSESQNSFMFPSTGRGFTVSRNENYAAPLALDLRYLPQHIDRVLRFVHIQPAVKDVGRIFFNHGFAQTLGILDPTIRGDMLVPWLQRAASQRVSTPSQGWAGKGIDSFFREVRKRTGLQLMLGNVSNTLQQFTGILPSLLKVKPRYLKSAVWTYIKSPTSTAEAVNEKSAFMKTRMTASTFEIQQTIDDLLLNPSAYEKARDFANKHGYFMQAATQNVVDVVTWTGAYDQAVANGSSEVGAVRAADSAVRLTQGSFAAEDISNFEGRSPFVRAFGMFYSYFNMQANLLRSEFQVAARDMGLRQGAGRVFYVYVMGFAAPAIVSEVIRRAVAGDGVDADDDEYYLDDVLSILFGSQFRAATSLLPIAGPIVAAGVNAWNHNWYDDRITTSPVVTALESTVRSPHSVYQAITEKGHKKEAVRDALTAIGLLTGLPTGALARPAGYLADVYEGKTEPEGAVDFTRGLVSGR